MTDKMVLCSMIHIWQKWIPQMGATNTHVCCSWVF